MELVYWNMRKHEIEGDYVSGCYGEQYRALGNSQFKLITELKLNHSSQYNHLSLEVKSVNLHCTDSKVGVILFRYRDQTCPKF